MLGGGGAAGNAAISTACHTYDTGAILLANQAHKFKVLQASRNMHVVLITFGAKIQNIPSYIVYLRYLKKLTIWDDPYPKGPCNHIVNIRAPESVDENPS